jgi:hypothetical protein
MQRRTKWIVVLLVVLVGLPLALTAQRGGRRLFDRAFGRSDQFANVRYDGRFTLVRIRYQAYGSWRADYPTMERNLATILRELTSLDPHVEGSNVNTFDDAELFKYPIAYLTEPGYWHPTDEEVVGLRNYLAKGGFLIVDDFHYADEWSVFEAGIRRVLPEATIDPLDVSHPVFNTFFAIESLEVPYPGRLGQMGLMGEFYGIHEDNDPTKPLKVVINYNMDIGDYMEWSSTNRYVMAPTNEAYKFAINYILYGLTH